MGHDRLFVLQIVVVFEEQWFATGTNGPPIRALRTYRIDDMLFAAADEAAAFRMGINWLENGAFTDSNRDGPGDLTQKFALGIHQLEEVGLVSEIAKKSHELYGISLPGFDVSDLDSNGVPRVRNKSELEVFRLLKFFRGGPAAT